MEDALLSIPAIPHDYLTLLGIAEYIAQNGVQRDPVGSSKPHAQSSGTRGPGDFGAMQIVEAERRYMRRRIPALHRALRSYVNGEDARKELAE